MDTHVAKHLRTKVFLGRLRGKCVILVTHDKDTIRKADRIVHISKEKEVVVYDSYQAYVLDYPEELRKMVSQDLEEVVTREVEEKKEGKGLLENFVGDLLE